MNYKLKVATGFNPAPSLVQPTYNVNPYPYVAKIYCKTVKRLKGITVERNDSRYIAAIGRTQKIVQKNIPKGVFTKVN